MVFVQHKHDDFDATPLGSSDSSPIHEPLSSGESTERYWMIDLFEGMCSTHTTNCGPCAQLSTHTMRLKDRCWYTKYSSFPGHYWIDNKLTVFTTTLQISVCHVIRHFLGKGHHAISMPAMDWYQLDTKENIHNTDLQKMLHKRFYSYLYVDVFAIRSHGCSCLNIFTW